MCVWYSTIHFVTSGSLADNEYQEVKTKKKICERKSQSWVSAVIFFPSWEMDFIMWFLHMEEFAPDFSLFFKRADAFSISC